MTIRVTDKQLSMYLDIWAEWTRNYDNRQHYSSRAHIGSGSGSSEFDAMVSSMESSQAKVIDAAIDDLPSNERIAVHHVKLASVWRLREPIVVVFARACDMLSLSLARRGLPTGRE
jgi:hypothetical protein